MFLSWACPFNYKFMCYFFNCLFSNKIAFDQDQDILVDTLLMVNFFFADDIVF